MKNNISLMVTIFGGLLLNPIAHGEPQKFPDNLRLPQWCSYESPHEDFGTVLIEKNDDSSVKVTGLEGSHKPMVLYYAETLESTDEIVFITKLGLPPEVKLLAEGGSSVFYGDPWGYSVNCVLKKP